MDRKTRFSQLTLQEPPKREVLAWRPGAGMPRKAYAVVRHGEKAFEAVVDLTADRVASWSPLKEVHPNWIEDDFKAMVDKVLEHPGFVSGLKARGITRHHLPRLLHGTARLLRNRGRAGTAHRPCPVLRAPRGAKRLDPPGRGPDGRG